MVPIFFSIPPAGLHYGAHGTDISGDLEIQPGRGGAMGSSDGEYIVIYRSLGLKYSDTILVYIYRVIYNIYIVIYIYIYMVNWDLPIMFILSSSSCSLLRVPKNLGCKIRTAHRPGDFKV